MAGRLALAAGLAAAAATLAVPARATAPPVGPLPRGPVTTIQVGHGLLFAVALPHRSGGLVWRGARRSDPTIARPLWEADVDKSVVLVYRAGHAGTTTLVYALTKGETVKAYEARFFKIVVR